jgi:8-oxo-dGTP pyrophosphatase MutT (NUDIX family)
MSQSSLPPTRPHFDPELLPVVAQAAGLSRVDAGQLTPDALRRRFAAPPTWQPEIVEEGRWARRDELAHAAVLVPLVVRPLGLSVLLTQRTAHLKHHAGQISFPGGRSEASDPDPVATALREADEEIALGARHVEVLGSLPDYLTGTNFRVTPVVALIHPPFTVEPDADEVAEIFEVPLSFLMDPAHHQVRLLAWEGGERRFFAMPYPRDDRAGDYFIWGATAGMLRNLYRFLVA